MIILKHLSCPACNGSTTIDLGRLRPYENYIPLEDPGNLYRCPSCGLFFRRPYPSPGDLEQFYRELPGTLWADTGASRKDFDLAADIITRTISSGDILDIGCLRADFLADFPVNLRKYGIEPNIAAADIARLRGINIIASSIENIPKGCPMFHAITVLDVIEHLPYPLDALRNLTGLIRPGGLMIVATGNTDALPWRLMRRDYWYYYPEHVSFFNPRWFHWAAKQLGLEVVLVKKYSHFNSSTFHRWQQFTTSVAFSIVKMASSYHTLSKITKKISILNGMSLWTSPPRTDLWSDHVLIVLRRS